VVYYESEYESAELSIEDFIALVTNIFAWQLDDEIIEMLDYENLLDAAYDEEPRMVWVGTQNGHFRVFWISCNGECAGPIPGRN
jgi:hypothetical protein